MEQYLALHNVSILDFWIFVALWFVGCFVVWLLFRFWYVNMKTYREDKAANGMITLTVIILLAFILPVMFMGLWHFINMVLALTIHSDLYCLLDMKLPAV